MLEPAAASRPALSSTTGFYSQRIDHLRFFAALLVMWWHWNATQIASDPWWVPQNPLLSLFDEGHIGVGLFFTLSGYLFYFISWGREVDYRGFLINRFLRIAPLMVVWTLLLYSLNIGQLNPIALVTAMLTTFGSLPGVGWSVLIEIQFYLLFPLLLRLGRERGLSYYGALLALLFLIRLAIWLYGGPVRTVAYSTMFGRLDQFLLGMLAAHWVICGREFTGRYAGALVIGLAIVVASTHYLNLRGGFAETYIRSPWVWLPLVHGVGWGLVIAGYAKVRLPAVPMFAGGLASLGEWSYSLYWSHVTIFEGTRGLYGFLGLPPLPTSLEQLLFFALLAVPATCAFSALSFYVIERPFIDMRRSYSRLTAPTA